MPKLFIQGHSQDVKKEETAQRVWATESLSGVQRQSPSRGSEGNTLQKLKSFQNSLS